MTGLTPAEKKISAAMHGKPGNFLTNEEILEAVGGVRGDDTLKVWISRIRRFYGLSCKELFCVREVGYGLTPEGYDVIAVGEPAIKGE